MNYPWEGKVRSVCLSRKGTVAPRLTTPQAMIQDVVRSKGVLSEKTELKTGDFYIMYFIRTVQSAFQSSRKGSVALKKKGLDTIKTATALATHTCECGWIRRLIWRLTQLIVWLHVCHDILLSTGKSFLHKQITY